jgi:cytochrome c553
MRKKYLTVAVLLVVVAALAIAVGLAVGGAKATPGLADRTGKSCGYCHVNSGGGGSLTAAGEAFVANGNQLPHKTTTTVKKHKRTTASSGGSTSSKSTTTTVPTGSATFTG